MDWEQRAAARVAALESVQFAVAKALVGSTAPRSYAPDLEPIRCDTLRHGFCQVCAEELADALEAATARLRETL